MMLYTLNPDGSVSVPTRAEGPAGLIGDGQRIVRPGDPGYEMAVRQAKLDAVYARRWDNASSPAA
jgi:hypothetical protein